MARKNSTKKEKAMRIPKISWMVKPEGMTLVRWQQALRQQIAREEVMVVSAVDERNVPGEYDVRNPKTRQAVSSLLHLMGKLFTQ